MYDPYNCSDPLVHQEWNSASREELLNHPYPPQCLFGNVADFFIPAVRAMLPELRSNDQFNTKLLPLVLTDKAVKMFLGYSRP